MIRANNDIYIELKKKIINYELKPGDILNEKELASIYGVSRTPIREAIIKLEQIGLVEIRARVGAFVTQVELIKIKDAYEVKNNLEAMAAELAAKRAHKDEIDKLFNIIEKIDGYDIVKDYKKCIEADQDFHTIIRQASRNDVLSEILDSVNTRTARFLHSVEYIIDDYDWFKNSLINMATAIRNRDHDMARIEAEKHVKNYLYQMSKKFFGL